MEYSYDSRMVIVKGLLAAWNSNAPDRESGW